MDVDLLLDRLLDQLDRPRGLLARVLVAVHLRARPTRPPLAQHPLTHDGHAAPRLALAEQQARKVGGLAPKLDGGIRHGLSTSG